MKPSRQKIPSEDILLKETMIHFLFLMLEQLLCGRSQSRKAERTDLDRSHPRTSLFRKPQGFVSSREDHSSCPVTGMTNSWIQTFQTRWADRVGFELGDPGKLNFFGKLRRGARFPPFFFPFLLFLLPPSRSLLPRPQEILFFFYISPEGSFNALPHLRGRRILGFPAAEDCSRARVKD